jgi:hypothetical protein
MKSTTEATLKLIGISSTDVIHLRDWIPASRDEVYVTLFIEIGVPERPRGNFFQAVIATPEGLRRHAEEHSEIPDRNLLLCLDYNWTDVEERIARIVASCARDTWGESVACLQRYFEWEYEDWRPDPGTRTRASPQTKVV